eukprot:PhF_6_TR11024/c0_g1_i1/m.17857
MWDYWLHVIAPVGTCGVLSILCLKTSLFHAQQISNNNTLQLTVTSSHPLWMTASTAILSIATVMFRKTKKHYNHKRLRWLHAFLMTAGTVGFNVGAYSAFREIVAMKNGKHLNSFHAQVGVIALLLLNLQALMGWLTMFPQWKKTHWNDRVSHPHGGNRNGLMWCRVCLWVVWILSILPSCFFDAKYFVVFVVGSSGGCCDRNLFEEVQLKNKKRGGSKANKNTDVLKDVLHMWKAESLYIRIRYSYGQ